MSRGVSYIDELIGSRIKYAEGSSRTVNHVIRCSRTGFTIVEEYVSFMDFDAVNHYVNRLLASSLGDKVAAYPRTGSRTANRSYVIEVVATYMEISKGLRSSR